MTLWLEKNRLKKSFSVPYQLFIYIYIIYIYNGIIITNWTLPRLVCPDTNDQT